MTEPQGIMASEPTVGIGIPTVGTSPYLVTAIQAVLAQTLPSWNLIISDNSSGSDAVRAQVEPFLDDPRVSYVCTGSRLTMGAHFTRLLRMSNAPYHALLHDDDLWEPEFLQRRIEFLEAHPACGYAFGGAVMIDEHGEARGRMPLDVPPGVHHGDEMLRALVRRMFIQVPTFVVRRSAYEAIGSSYKDLVFAHDEVLMRLSSRFDAGCLDVWDSRYRHHPGQASAHRTDGINHLALLDAIADLPVADSDRRYAFAVANLRRALDAAQRGGRREALASVAQAVRRDPVSCLTRPHLIKRIIAASAAVLTGDRGRQALERARERSWHSGGSDGLLPPEPDRPKPTDDPLGRSASVPDHHAPTSVGSKG